MKLKKIQIRVSNDDKKEFIDKAKTKGFDTISAYIRHLIKNDKN